MSVQDKVICSFFSFLVNICCRQRDNITVSTPPQSLQAWVFFTYVFPDYTSSEGREGVQPLTLSDLLLLQSVPPSALFVPVSLWIYEQLGRIHLHHCICNCDMLTSQFTPVVFFLVHGVWWRNAHLQQCAEWCLTEALRGRWEVFLPWKSDYFLSCLYDLPSGGDYHLFFQCVETSHFFQQETQTFTCVELFFWKKKKSWQFLCKKKYKKSFSEAIERKIWHKNKINNKKKRDFRTIFFFSCGYFCFSHMELRTILDQIACQKHLTCIWEKPASQDICNVLWLK